MTRTGPGGAPIVAFESVDVAYRERTVLRDVSFEVEPGERVALVGPNGAGKSSLLRALAGLAPLRHGQIRLDGQPIQTLDRAAIARRISAVPAASLPFAMRVEEVVAQLKADVRYRDFIEWETPAWSPQDFRRYYTDAAQTAPAARASRVGYFCPPLPGRTPSSRRPGRGAVPAPAARAHRIWLASDRVRATRRLPLRLVLRFQRDADVVDH